MASAAPLAERKITLIMIVYLLRRRLEEESSDLKCLLVTIRQVYNKCPADLVVPSLFVVTKV